MNTIDSTMFGSIANQHSSLLKKEEKRKNLAVEELIVPFMLDIVKITPNLLLEKLLVKVSLYLPWSEENGDSKINFYTLFLNENIYFEVVKELFSGNEIKNINKEWSKLGLSISQEYVESKKDDLEGYYL